MRGAWQSSRRCRVSLTPALAFNAQIAHEPLETLLVAVVLFPAGEVSDVALTPQQTRPGFRGLYHGSSIRKGKRTISLRVRSSSRALVTSPSTQSLAMAPSDRINRTLSLSRIASSMASMIFAELLGVAFPAHRLLADECLLAF
jgi:hypothetical protein